MYSERQTYDLINEAVLKAQVELRLCDQDLAEILGIRVDRIQSLRTYTGIITKKESDSLNRAIGLVLITDSLIDIFEAHAFSYLQTVIPKLGPNGPILGATFLTLLKDYRNFKSLNEKIEELVSEDFLATKRCLRESRLSEEFMREKYLLIEEIEVDFELYDAFPTYIPRKKKPFLNLKAEGSDR